VTAPPNPYALPGGKLTAQAQAGKAVFLKPAAIGGGDCGACHSGPLGTSGLTVEGKTKGELTDVPSLLGAYDTAPYGRQGQWFTLGDMIDFALEFTGAKLSASDRDAVLAYVQQLPGDLLTLNSATPLAGADHVWKEVAPELIFSAVLAKGQEGMFHFVKIAEDGSETPVKGSWTLSGRAARFKIDAGALELESSYRIDVDAGLKSALGQSTTQDIPVAFTTGGTPAFDISGQWKMTLSSPTVGTITVNVAVLMATGGKMTGVVLDSIDQASLGADAITGVVSGTTLQLDPFYVDSDFGKFYVKDGFASTLEDTTKDGFADKGKGAFDFKFGNTVFPIAVTWKRTALPKG
jgi:mono/diheme cytochrome c family protein